MTENEIFWFFENQLLDHGETKDKFFLNDYMWKLQLVWKVIPSLTEG